MPFGLYVIKMELIKFSKIKLYRIYLNNEMTAKFSNFNFRK